MTAANISSLEPLCACPHQPDNIKKLMDIQGIQIRKFISQSPNIAYLPVPEPPEQNLKAAISLKAGDNISTDDITPASAEFSSMRSNIMLMSKYCFYRYDSDFEELAKNLGKCHCANMLQLVPYSWVLKAKSQKA